MAISKERAKELAGRFVQVVQEHEFPATDEFFEIFPSFKHDSRAPSIFPVKVSTLEEHGLFVALVKRLVADRKPFSYDFGYRSYLIRSLLEELPYYLIFVHVHTPEEGYAIRTSSSWVGRFFCAEDIITLLEDQEFDPKLLVARVSITKVGNKQNEEIHPNEEKSVVCNDYTVIKTIFL